MKSCPLGFDQKICPGGEDLAVFENLPGCCLGEGVVTLGIELYVSRTNLKGKKSDFFVLQFHVLF